ncbi:2403_t:CDS:1 [Entrophospora sp. SA101]|nr:14244_t:CDS:1 [Entrophospora sp. SA101]CAJ0633592.1 1062_t:CDS:1 [Entrophospora sp. SA101]CAJ0749941.1 17531_t:CDS:1 [Entrophospora sp. SA101]CAJ0765545.1 2403_t:CDS:1 [Entrophospora sp. SA101]CAJ0842110.1 1131_t:CDS:1 [Entrophospora sp. SA101]
MMMMDSTRDSTTYISSLLSSEPPEELCIPTTICLETNDSEDEETSSQQEEPIIHHDNHRKSVQFSRFLVVHETWCNDEYDRTSTEPARLSFKDYTELLQIKIDLRKEADKMTKASAVVSDHQSTNTSNNHQHHV